nr:protein RRP5 homolog [Leptinotarsa decemlineata]
MSQNEEEYFPRGGQVKKNLKRPKQDDNLFSHKTHDKTKKPRKEKKSPKETLNDDAFHSLLKIQGSLSYKTIRSGMLILGCIRCTTNFTIEVELPGLTFGHIKIIHISDPLTKYLNEKLEKQDDEASEILGKIFKVGQFVLVKVLNIEIRENGDYVECSLNPSDIYSEKTHNTFEKGMLMWASVRSVLDHGFELDVGVKNCRVFLPSKNVDAGKDLAIGETLWCTIHKCDSSNTATTLRVSCRDEHLKATKIDEIKTLDDLIPGMQIEILIEKITAKGIHAKFLNDYFGFVDENQLSTPSKKLDDYKEGKLITAYVLYIDHPTKITYLTLRNLDTVPAPVTKIGAIMSAQVLSKTYKGIYLRLPSDEKGFVTNKRLMNCLPKNANLDISESISLKFGAGSKHTCRILDYNRLSRLYICTVEQALIKEQIFMPSDVKIGQVVNVTVTSVKNEGLEVSLGHTKGFVPNLFLSNVEYSEAIKKKYQEGFKSKARVLNIDNDTVLLTMKPGQVDSENCLTDLLQAKRGDQYTGVVIHLKSEGALVLFYGNVKGWLSRNYLGGRNGKEKLDVTKYFYRGQIVNPWVLRVKSDRVILGLKQPEEFKQCLELEIGQRVSGVVGRVMKDSIEVRSVKKQVIGNIPVNHLGTRVSLCPSLMIFQSTLAYFTGHLNDVRALRNFGNENQWNLCEYLPGERVDCQIERLGEKGGCLVKLPNGAPGLVSPGLCPGKVEVGTSITGVFLSQNFHDNYTEIALKPDICQRINKVQDGSTQLTSLSSCLMETVVIKHDYVLGVLKQEKGNRQLVYIPIFLHENDQEGSRSYYEKSKVRINIIGKVEDYLIGMSKKLLSTFEKSKLINSKHKELRKKKKKAKVEVSESEDEQIDTQEVETEEEDTEVKEESEEEEETSGKEDSGVEVSENDREMRDKQLKQTGVKRKLQSPNSNATITHDKNSSSPGSAPVMSGISSFFAPESKMEQDSSSDDEGEPTEVKKKRKLTPAERANLAREEEERISKIEKELADSTKAPESAEQFDRLLLANPNSSELWTKYIALHTAATEFDKARAVARRALESINLTLVDERFNIWLALLNLENMLGTKESFDKTFNDALTHNDSLQVYLKTIQMLAEAGKFSEMEEKIRKVRNKHKQEPSMWLEVAKVYYKINQFKEARNLKDASLKSIMDKKTQMEIIVRFAIMEYKFGEEEQGAAIFETILSSDPKKVNVWSTYVDQLVKKNKIDQARKVLERSVCQRLPLKSMKSLFLKFRMFEEQHGTLESVEAVKEKAKEYAAKVSNR